MIQNSAFNNKIIKKSKSNTSKQKQNNYKMKKKYNHSMQSTIIESI